MLVMKTLIKVNKNDLNLYKKKKFLNRLKPKITCTNLKLESLTYLNRKIIHYPY